MSKFDLARPARTREEVITSMCYTWSHDFGLEKQPIFPEVPEHCHGFTDEEREALWQRMAQLYEHHVAPYREAFDDEDI